MGSASVRLGRIQELALEIVTSASGPITVNEVCWRVVDTRGRGRATLVAARRAVHGLVERKHLTVRQERLSTFDQIIAIYPYKTEVPGVRQMRVDLLPLAGRYLEESARPPRYSLPRQEAFILGQGTPEELERIRNTWDALRDRLYSTLGTIDASSALKRAASEAIAWGLGTLEGIPISAPRGLVRIVKDLEQAGADASTIAMAEALRQVAFPRPNVERAALKNQLCLLVNHKKNAPPSLEGPFRKWLVQEAPGYCEELDGTRGPRVRLKQITRALLLRDVHSLFSFVSRQQPG